MKLTGCIAHLHAEVGIDVPTEVLNKRERRCLLRTCSYQMSRLVLMKVRPVLTCTVDSKI